MDIDLAGACRLRSKKVDPKGKNPLQVRELFDCCGRLILAEVTPSARLLADTEIRGLPFSVLLRKLAAKTPKQLPQGSVLGEKENGKQEQASYHCSHRFNDLSHGKKRNSSCL